MGVGPTRIKRCRPSAATSFGAAGAHRTLAVKVTVDRISISPGLTGGSPAACISRTAIITGRGGGETGRLVEIHVHAPGTTSAEVQEVQRTILHAMCALVEDALGADAAGAGRAERTNA